MFYTGGPTEEELPDAYLLPVDSIENNPNQPRRRRNPEKDAELAESIKVEGIIQPLVVYPSAGDAARYFLIAGNRRLDAARAVGVTEVPAVVRRGLNELQIALLMAAENGQRDDLDPEDEGRQYQYMLELSGLSQRGLAERLGIKHNYLSERVRALGRPDLLERYRYEEITWKQLLAELAKGESESEDGGEVEGESESVSAPPKPTGFKARPLTAFLAWLEQYTPQDVPDAEWQKIGDQLLEAQGLIDSWLGGR